MNPDSHSLFSTNWKSIEFLSKIYQRYKDNKKFANEINLNHTEVKITPKTFLENWNKSIKYIEEPRYSWNLPMYYLTNKVLSKHNTVVTFAGDIGDEIFGGYSKYLKMHNLITNGAEIINFIL